MPYMAVDASDEAAPDADYLPVCGPMCLSASIVAVEEYNRGIQEMLAQDESR